MEPVLPPPLFWILIAGAVSVVSFGYLLVEFCLRDRLRVWKRVQEEFGKAPAEVEQKSPLFKESAQSWSLPTELGTAEIPKLSFRQKLDLMIDQSGLQVSVPGLILWSAGLGLGLGCTVSFAQSTPLIGPCIGLIAAASPFLYVRAKWKARQERLLSQLADAFDLMARVIRAGQSLAQAFLAVAEEFKGPVAVEFSYCYEQQNLGLSFETALRDLAQRTGLLEIKVFVMATLVHQESGGNIVHMLEKLATVVRGRTMIHSKVKVVTAEGRMQATVLLAMPPAAFLAMLILNPDYAHVLLDHPGVLYAMAGALILGGLWIRKIVRFTF
jgi:tight adherence protein B